MIPPLHEAPLEDCCGGRLKQAPFGQVKDALSAGASSMIIQPTGKEFYSQYIQWSIIGGVHQACEGCHGKKIWYLDK